MSRLAALRLLHTPLRAAPLSARAVGRSCAGDLPPPAKPPCARRPRTPCRPPPACRDSIAERRVCCAPARARQPPCPARPPAAPRTCAAARRASNHAEPCEEPCGGQDRVAVRLAAADDARRRQYEEDAAQRAACGAAPPPTAEYAPGAARDCLRAVDGRTYSLPCRLPPLARCGPGREPPLSRAVPLARQPGCRLEREPDPCAHRPPVFLHVDRTSSLPSPALPPAPTELPEPRAPGACGPTRRHPRGLAERIVSGLRGDRPPERSLHTAAAAGLREAGLGRARVPCAVPPAPPPAAGRLELAVPAGASRVNVLVTMSAPGGGQCARGGKGDQPPAPLRRRASWLSISSIRRKFAGCGGGSDAKKPSKCPSTPTPCCPTAPACPSKPPVPPPKRKKAPSCPCEKKPSPCDKPGSKTKFYPLTATIIE